MRQVHEVLRQRVSGDIPNRGFAQRLGIAASTVFGTVACVGAHTGFCRDRRVGPHQLVPDNNKVGVIRVRLYDPQTNRICADMAAHYDTSILPARPHKPCDLAKA
jgi:hypothetical protein